MTLAEPVLIQTGQIVSVYETRAGSSLAAALTGSATVVALEDVDDFADEGGELSFSSIETTDQSSEALRYVAVDRVANTVTLALAYDPTLPLYAVGDSVWIAPPTTERRAEVALDGETDQVILARIAYNLSPQIPLGIRDEGAGEWVRLDVTDYGYAVRDVLGQYALTDPSSIAILNPSTGETTGELGPDAAFDTVTADEVFSPSVPRRNAEPLTVYVDAALGSDDNDGTGLYPLVDKFERVQAGPAWGTADSGHVWTNLQQDGLNDVGVQQAGFARMRLPATGAGQAVERSAFAPLDVEVFGIYRPQTQVFTAAGNTWGGWGGRMVDKDNWLAGGIVQSPTGQHSARVFKRNAGSNTAPVSGDVVLGTYPVNTDFYLRVQFLTNPDGGTDVKVKAWLVSASEPDDWTVTANVTDSVLQNAAGVGCIYQAGGSVNTQTSTAFGEMTASVLDPEGNVVDTSGATVGPYATIAAALDLVGEWNDADCRIVLAGTFDESIFVNGLVGGGRLFITGGGTATVYGVVRFYGVTQYVELRDMTLQDTGDGTTSGTVEVRTSRHVEVMGVKFQTNSQRSYNAFYTEGSDGRVQDCQLSGATAYCVHIAEESTVMVQDNSGSAGSGSYRSGLSILWINGTKPSGATATTFGGQIFGSNTTSGGGTAPPTSTKVTKTFAPNASRTWRPEWGWREDNDETYQGEYAGSGGLSRGAAFYGTKLNIAGKTADSGKVFVKRLSTGGASQDQGVYLFAHDLGSQPASDTASPTIKDGPTKVGELAWGEGKWFDIPKAWVQDMLNGTGGRRGFGLYKGSASPYIICAGKKNGGDVWKVKLTYH